MLRGDERKTVVRFKNKSMVCVRVCVHMRVFVLVYVCFCVHLAACMYARARMRVRASISVQQSLKTPAKHVSNFVSEQPMNATLLESVSSASKLHSRVVPETPRALNLNVPKYNYASTVSPIKTTSPLKTVSKLHSRLYLRICVCIYVHHLESIE